MKRKGLIGDAVTNILAWIAFLIVAALVVYLLVKRLTA
jgi:hypothetical protein